MKKGFTLAEVLITLAIIGIVAAVTIPSVIANVQQQEFKTGLRKAVSILNEAILTNIVTEGETPFENENLDRYLKRHMNIIKTGRADARKAGEGMGNTAYYLTDGMRYEICYNCKFKLHESDVIVGNVGNCGTYGLVDDISANKMKRPCFVTVDVNGDKKPNMLATNENGFSLKYTYPMPFDKRISDVFTIMITDDKAIPFGVVAQRAMYEK